MSFDLCRHSSDTCFFKTRKWRYNRRFLSDWDFVQHIKAKYGFCTCYEYAYIKLNPKLQSLELEEHEFIDIAINAGFLFDEKITKYSYTVQRNEGMVYIDMNVGDILQEYFPDIWKETFEYSKTPKVGRMYFALLNYLYPEQPFPLDNKFRLAYELAFTEVFNQIDTYEVASLQTAIDNLPRSTSAGFISIRKTSARHKKGDILKEVIDGYHEMERKILRNQEAENYIMFAARGHLSKKTALKTRAIWMQSAETILLESRFAHGLYQQFNKKWWRDRMIHGSGSMKRLREYLQSDRDFHFCNTDISGWDAFRAIFLHKRFYRELKTKIIMSNRDSKLYDYMNINSNIESRVIFPSGRTFKTKGGLKSGSEWTLAQNTILNMILGHTALNLMGVNNSYDIKKKSWLGDDFSLITTKPFDAKYFGFLLLKYFGLEIKPEKSFFAGPNEDRKFLGYEIRGGFLYKDLKELWPGILYTEHYFNRNFDSIAKSFTRLFSYLILGGIQNIEYVEFFYLFLGKYGTWLDKVEYIFDDQSFRMTRVLKDIYNVKISKFNSSTFKKMSLYLAKYILLYDYDLIQIDKELIKV